MCQGGAVKALSTMKRFNLLLCTNPALSVWGHSIGVAAAYGPHAPIGATHLAAWDSWAQAEPKPLLRCFDAGLAIDAQVSVSPLRAGPMEIAAIANVTSMSGACLAHVAVDDAAPPVTPATRAAFTGYCDKHLHGERKCREFLPQGHFFCRFAC